MKDAMTIRRADKKVNCDTDLQAIGFVFSDEEVDAVIEAEDTLEAAKRVLSQERMDKLAGYALI